jgi:hypothetical protein
MSIDAARLKAEEVKNDMSGVQTSGWFPSGLISGEDAVGVLVQAVAKLADAVIALAEHVGRHQ